MFVADSWFGSTVSTKSDTCQPQNFIKARAGLF